MSRSHFHHGCEHARDQGGMHLLYLKQIHPFQPPPELYLINPNMFDPEIILFDIFLDRHI